MKAASKGSVKATREAPRKSKQAAFEYDEDSDEYNLSDDAGRSNGKSHDTKKQSNNGKHQPEADYDEGHYEEEEEITPEYLEDSLIRTIKEFGTFVASITRDLEKQEQEMVEEMKAKGKKVPKLTWADSTFKVEFTQGVLLKFFEHKASRLMKYYIVILLPMKKWITKRQEKFFLRAQIFPGAPEEDIKFFRDLWGIEGAMTPAEKKTSWDYWDTQIEIVEDWLALTKWEVDPAEKLNIPNVDYDKAARDAAISDSE